MKLAQRKLLMGALVASFAIQTAMVYADDTASTFEVLSEDALEGRRIWHEYNCQTCHQIHGFGGFLGPDLTNYGLRMTDERLNQILTEGSAQMPAFHFDEDQIYYMGSFLDELSDMGQGVPRSVRVRQARKPGMPRSSSSLQVPSGVRSVTAMPMGSKVKRLVPSTLT